MAAFVTASVNRFNTDAGFQEIGRIISGSLGQFGWQLVSTNLNWNTVLAPTAASQFRGYELWRSTDAFSTIYFFLEWGTGGNGSNDFLWRTSVGYNTNGSGSVTVRGNNTSAYPSLETVSRGSNTSPPEFVIVCSGDSSSFSFAMAPGQNGFYVSLERTKDLYGNINDDGLHYTVTSETVAPSYYYLDRLHMDRSFSYESTEGLPVNNAQARLITLGNSYGGRKNTMVFQNINPQIISNWYVPPTDILFGTEQFTATPDDKIRPAMIYTHGKLVEYKGYARARITNATSAPAYTGIFMRYY